MKIRFEPYKLKSRSCRAIADHLGVLRTTPRQVRKHGEFDIIINWGATQRRFPNARYINDPEAVVHACDKEATLRILTACAVPCPDWTTVQDDAEAWWESGDTVVARKYTRAHSGRGIVLSSQALHTPVPRAPLYTRYIKKADEYRVHVVAGQVIDVAQKRKRREVDNDDVNYQIRNAGNGWVYCRDGVDAPAAVLDAGRAAVSALGLDFGAADVGWNAHKQEPCVYEVNTAPGLEGSTLDKYRQGIMELLPALKSGRYATRRAMV